MLDLFSSAVKKVTGKVTGLVANTEYGKNQWIKPQLQAKIATSKEKIDDIISQLEEEDSPINNSPKLKSTLKKFKKKVNEFIADFSSDDTLDPIVDVIANHFRDYENVNEFQETIQSSESAEALEELASKIVDMETYEVLKDKMENIADFSSLETEDQIKFLGDKQLVRQIKEINDKVKLDKIKAKVEEIGSSLCDELNFSYSEKNKIVGIFNALTAEYLPALDNIRKQLIKHLPQFMEGEKQRLLEENPHLAVHIEGEKNKKSITSQFKKKKKNEEDVSTKTKSCKSGKKRKEPEDEEASDEEASKSKTKTNKKKLKS